MSMSRPEATIENPINNYYSFNMNKGEFRVNSKNEEGEYEEKYLPFPFRFIVVDDSVEQIKGLGEGKRQINSNFGRKGSIYTVRFDGRIAVTGKWKDLKEDINLPKGAKYNRVLYIYDVDRKQYGALYFSGNGVAAYFKHQNDAGVKYCSGRLFDIKASALAEKSDENYIPVFESRPLDETAAAKKMKEELTKWDDEVLQPYLDSVIGSNHVEEKPVDETGDSKETSDPEDDLLPF